MMNERPSSGLHIASSPFLEPLTDLLGENLSVVISDPFAPDLVVVPNIGVRDWLQRELCHRLAAGRANIVANISFLFVQQFLDLVYAASGSTASQVWDIDHLTWYVHRAIDEVGRDSVPGARTNPLSTARIVADLFDRYATHRPSMLQYWSSGRATDGVDVGIPLPDEVRWQHDVYRAVRRLIARQADVPIAPSERLAALAETVSRDGLPGEIPDSVSVFGFSTLNATMRVTLDAVSRVRPVYTYLLHPLRRSNSRTGDDAPHRSLVPREFDGASGVVNPLLARWARPSLETPDLLPTPWVDAGGRAATHVLGRLQQALVTDEELALRSLVLDESKTTVRTGDGSIQVHACHGNLRQVEVLRDVLLHLLNNDPTLHLSDISIQCPDLLTFAPIIPAVFRSGDHSPAGVTPSLDVMISDKALSGDNPYEDAFWSLMSLATSRCGVVDVLGALALAPVRRRFDVDIDDLARAEEWFEAVAVRFGLDGGHRQQWDVPDSVRNGSWDSALDRLYMGFAVSAEKLFIGPGDIVPHDDVSVTDARGLGAVADFLHGVGRLSRHVAEPHSIIEWERCLRGVIETFFEASEESEYRCRDLHDAISRLVEGAVHADIDVNETFTYEEISDLVRDQLANAGTRPQFRSGAITVTDLLPQQGVPYRVVALLGATEQMFLPSGGRGDDVLSLRPCIGDPMPSGAGRQQLLNLVLAAQDSLIITCTGADINTNHPVPLPVPIQELLEAAVAISDTGQFARSMNMFTSHPRQSFSPINVALDRVVADKPFTFDPIVKRVHDVRMSSEVAPTKVIHTEPTAGRLDELQADGLRRVVSRPAEYFGGDVLDIRLPEQESSAIADHIEIWPSHLTLSRAGRELLNRMKRAPDDLERSVDEWARDVALSGAFPPGRLAMSSAHDVAGEVLEMVQALPEGARHFAGLRDAVIEIDPMNGPSLVTGVVSDIRGTDLVRIAYRRYHESLLLEPWVDLALVTLAQPEEAFTVRYVARPPKAGKSPTTKSFSMLGSTADIRRAHAQRVLETTVTLVRAFSTGLVPYLPRTSATLVRKGSASARKAFDKDCEYSAEASFFFGRRTWEEFIGEPSGALDPPGTATSRAVRVAHYVWDAFDATIEMTDGSVLTAEDHR